jgi:hypothetical protein
MNHANQLAKGVPNRALAVDRQPLGQSLGKAPVLVDPGDDRQLVAARQNLFGAAQAAWSDPVEHEADVCSSKDAQLKHLVGSLEAASVRNDHPQEPIGGCRQLTLKSACAMTKVDHHRLLPRARLINELETIDRFGCGLSDLRERKPCLDARLPLAGRMAIRTSSRHHDVGVKQGSHASTLSVTVEEKRRDGVRCKAPCNRHRKKGAPRAAFGAGDRDDPASQG